VRVKSQRQNNTRFEVYRYCTITRANEIPLSPDYRSVVALPPYENNLYSLYTFSYLGKRFGKFRHDEPTTFSETRMRPRPSSNNNETVRSSIRSIHFLRLPRESPNILVYSVYACSQTKRKYRLCVAIEKNRWGGGGGDVGGWGWCWCRREGGRAGSK